MGKRVIVVLVLITLCVISINCMVHRERLDSSGPYECRPVIVAHRGASGYAPEHTAGAYALAVTMGADYIEPDLVITKDGHLIARHENELSLTTDVAYHPEFASRYRTQYVNGDKISGWFSEDFTLAEIKTLKSIERFPNTRPGNTRMNRAYDILTFQEIINLIKGLEISENRTIGLYPEIKYSTHFKRLGLAMEQKLVDIFHRNGYIGDRAPAYIQSFEVNNLKELKTITEIRLIQLLRSNKSNMPFDQFDIGTNLTYGEMSTPEGLSDIASYASAVGPDKSYIIPRDDNDNLGIPTNFVNDAHKRGLKVHPYTFRSENSYLPRQFRSSEAEYEIGNLQEELNAFLAVGIDGAFIDQPDILNSLLTLCN